MVFITQTELLFDNKKWLGLLGHNLQISHLLTTRCQFSVHSVEKFRVINHFLIQLRRKPQCFTKFHLTTTNPNTGKKETNTWLEIDNDQNLKLD